MTEWWQVGVAIYAAVVATGALFLEVRRWFEDRPRLFVRVSPGMVTINIPATEGNEYVIVNVTNRGALPTTLTNLCLLEYRSGWHRLRGRNNRAGVIADPSLPGTSTGQLPHVLPPGGEWRGAIIQDDELREWMGTGRLYVAVYASHADRPTLRHLRPERPDGANVR